MKAIDFAKEAGDTNAEAQCKILFAISVWGSTMIFGDIPYSEAWRIEEIKTPKFNRRRTSSMRWWTSWTRRSA